MPPSDVALRAPGRAGITTVATPATSTSVSWTPWITLLIVSAIALAYANSFPGAFFFDDDDAILRNASIRDLHDLRQVFWPPVQAGVGGRPFGNLTFALNYALGGYSPVGYHVVNLVIHMFGAALLFALARRTLLRPVMRERFGEAATAIAAALALLWALHPLETNVVDYMSQRTEGLMAALYLLTLYGFARSVEEESRPWFITALIACTLGMATKEGMVTVPVIALLYDRTFLSGSFRDALRRNGPKYLALAATWILLAGLVYFSKPSERGIGFGLGHTAWDYALTECRTIVGYIQRSLWPQPLLFDYGPLYLHWGLEAAIGVTVLALVVAGTIVALWRAPVLGFAGAWFLVILSPSSSVVPVVQQPCAENRLYLPLAGVVALVAVGGYRLLGRRAIPALFVVAGALGAMTYHRNPVFSSELAIWWDTVPKRPENARAENNLGNALLKRNQNDRALPHFEAAIRLSPNYADAHNNRGVTLLRAGNPTEAAKEFEIASKDKENYGDAFYNLGEAYLQLGRPAEAITPLQRALRIDPTNSKAHNNLGIALLDTGRVRESIDEERIALALDPDMPEAHYNLGNSLSRAGRDDEALDEYAEALKINPQFAKAHNNSGVILLHHGLREDAAKRFEAALKIDPKYPEARRNLELVRGAGR